MKWIVRAFAAAMTFLALGETSRIDFGERPIGALGATVGPQGPPTAVLVEPEEYDAHFRFFHREESDHNESADGEDYARMRDTPPEFLLVPESKPRSFARRVRVEP